MASCTRRISGRRRAPSPLPCGSSTPTRRGRRWRFPNKENLMNGFRMGRTVGVMAVAFGLAAGPVDTWAQSCPPELAEAKKALERATATAQSASELPRTLAGARDEIQAPRGQEIQSPRGQDIQSPRGQEIQSPRGQDIHSPRTTVGARTSGAATAAALVSEAEAAWLAGSMALSAQRAKAALEVLRWKLYSGRCS